MSFNKNGIIKSGSFYDLDAMKMNATTNIAYTPQANTLNSCLGGELISGFKQGKQYYVQATLVWNGFTTNTPSGFSMWAQGDTWNGSSTDWKSSNPLAGAINGALSGGSLTSTVLSASSGSKVIRATFSGTSRTKYRLGIRTDNSNGTGKIGLEDIKVVPLEYAADGVLSSIKILSDHISAYDIKEY